MLVRTTLLRFTRVNSRSLLAPLFVLNKKELWHPSGAGSIVLSVLIGGENGEDRLRVENNLIAR